MTGFSRPDADGAYAVHNEWLTGSLVTGASLLAPEKKIWTSERLAELEGCFVESPDFAEKMVFIDKLERQLVDVSDDAVLLMAELHLVHFLMIYKTAIGGPKKRKDIETILGWRQLEIDLPTPIVDALQIGIAHPGQWALTYRNIQLNFLIAFASAAVITEDWLAVANDPWRLRSFVQGIETADSDEAARRAILHLAHPDTFELIVQPKHAQRIVERYRGSLDGVDDLDRELLAIRSELNPRFGRGFHWYAEPIVNSWNRDAKKWSEFCRWIGRVREIPEFDEWERTYKLELVDVLRTARQAVIDDDAEWPAETKRALRKTNLVAVMTKTRMADWIEEAPESCRRTLLAIWGSDFAPGERIDALEASRPDDQLQTPGERLSLSSVLLMADGAEHHPPLKISLLRKAWRLTGWGEPDSMSVSETYDRAMFFFDELVASVPALRDRLDAQGAVWSMLNMSEPPPSFSHAEWAELQAVRDDEQESGTKSGEDEPPVSSPGVDHLAAAAADLLVDRSELDKLKALLEDKGQIVLYGPPGTGKTFLAKRLARALAHSRTNAWAVVQFHPATTYEDFIEGLRPTVVDGQVHYEVRPGPLVSMAKAANDDPDHTYVMVIDEINRANLPKVLGELLFLLEYRNEPARLLYRPDEPFTLPSNLWFIGTMNTADRSISLIDAAMRRRFHFVRFFPEHGPMKGLLQRWLAHYEHPPHVAGFVQAVNDELRPAVGDHLLLGPSFFMRDDLSMAGLEQVWEHNVYPLLEEQFWGQPDELMRWRWDAIVDRFATQLGIDQGTDDDAAESDDE